MDPEQMTNWSAARSAVALEALDVPPETTITALCPVCGGGQSGERKLSVTRTHNGAMYCCHRASCGFRGFVAIGEHGSKDTPRKPAPARPLGLETVFDPGRAYEFYDQYSGFHRSTRDVDIRFWGVSWAGEDRVYECRGFHGELLGHVTRSPDKTIRTFRAREGGEMYSAYYVGAPDVVLVEDCVSAMCVASHGATGVALLGTNVPDSVARWLRQVPPRSLLVWLDPDAETTSLAIAARYRWAKAVIGFDQDPKDLADLGAILASYV